MENQQNQHFGSERAVTRDGHNVSLWQRNMHLGNQNGTFDPSFVYDALIVGAGITGITAALLLQRAGRKCIIADAHHAGYGTTGGTTAHINTFADSTYAEVESAFSEEASKQFAKSISQSVSLITELVDKYEIECEYERKKAYVYAQTEDEVKELDDMLESTLRAGVQVEVTQNAPAPQPYLKALEYDHQAQFHPLKYILALQREFVSLGGVVLENTRIEEISTEDEVHTAKSPDKEIKANAVFYATHIPPGGVNLLHFRNAPYRSYVIAATLRDDAYPDALVYDLKDPYHYFRTHEVDGQKYLIVGGHDHKTGHGDPEQSFEDLINFTKSCYEVAEVSSKWSAQFYVPTDGLPYIGHLPGASKGIYAATGYNGNGIILGTVAAIVVSDLIMRGDSEFKDLFDPGRIKPIAGFTEFIKENADVANRFVADRIGIDKIDSVAQLAIDSGDIVEYDGQKLAIYKDSKGQVHALDPVCTHTGCIVKWNGSEKSWDCPCHGGRFNAHGQVLTGPTRLDLEQVPIGSQSEV
ncbi:FAD-dependent oxidoreductase [Dyadobacter crusticola]|uniref:FAD-dependent oxidoreductase n=1 Tax=Dyadobacter crusticola TaxID=292407 RepID=UPI0005538A1C|nr:FAD-dependent oxidoreductase [Dyadobacter crusticola]